MRRRLAASGLAMLLLLAACSEADDSEFVFVAADDVGDDPFTDDIATPVPVEFTDVQSDILESAEQAAAALGADATSSEVRTARLTAATVVAEQNGLSVTLPASDQGVGLYGGSGVNACDVEGLVGFLEANPEKATAWAEIQGIEPSNIASFVRSLTPGFLVDEARVVNHTFTDGEARPIPSMMEAGTAVLVDSDGVPRVRCKCGNPLLPESAAGLADVQGFWKSVDERSILAIQSRPDGVRVFPFVPGNNFDTVDSPSCGTTPRYELVYDVNDYRTHESGLLKADLRVAGTLLTCDVKEETVPFFMDTSAPDVLAIYSDDSRLVDPTDSYIRIKPDFVDVDLDETGTIISGEISGPNSFTVYRLELEAGQEVTIQLQEISDTEGFALSGWVAVAEPNLRPVYLTSWEFGGQTVGYSFQGDFGTFTPEELGAFVAAVSGEYNLIVSGAESDRYRTSGKYVLNIE